MRFSHVLAALPLASGVVAQNVENCVEGGVCYRVNIPAATASSGSGDIFVQVTGPSNLQWLGIGQGTQMRGANIFMIYSNEAGNNVTVSPRLGAGQRQPSTSGATSQITLLAGSGIADGEITANFKCSNCNTWSGGSMDFTSSASNWIWAYRSGQAIGSNSLDASLSEHSEHGTMQLNLQSGTGGSSANPFVAAGSSSSPTTAPPSTATGSGTSSQTSSTTGSSGSNSGSGSSGSSSGSARPRSTSTKILIAHGVVMGLAFALFYPLGAMSMRLLNFRGLVWFHAGWMIFTFAMAAAGMGLGVWFAVRNDYMSSNHAIIGLVVVGALAIQPVTGLVHHRIFKRKGSASITTDLHVWWGRAVITLGIINGGLGLKLAGNTKNGEIVYGVVAGVMWVIWMAVVIFATAKKGKNSEGHLSGGSNEKINHAATRNGSSRESNSPAERGTTTV